MHRIAIPALVVLFVVSSLARADDESDAKTAKDTVEAYHTSLLTLKASTLNYGSVLTTFGKSLDALYQTAVTANPKKIPDAELAKISDYLVTAGKRMVDGDGEVISSAAYYTEGSTAQALAKKNYDEKKWTLATESYETAYGKYKTTNDIYLAAVGYYGTANGNMIAAAAILSKYGYGSE